MVVILCLLPVCEEVDFIEILFTFETFTTEIQENFVKHVIRLNEENVCFEIVIVSTVIFEYFSIAMFWITIPLYFF